MERGNISNKTVPTLILVFEGALGKLNKEDEKAFEKAFRRRKWKDAVYLWELNEPLCWQITRVFMQERTIEVVTFFGDEFAAELETRLTDKEDLPIHKVWATEPHLLARKITLRNDVAACYDADPSHRFTYGGKGRVLQRAAQFGS